MPASMNRVIATGCGGRYAWCFAALGRSARGWFVRLAVLVLCGGMATLCPAKDSVPLEALLQRGLNSFDEGVTVARDDPGQARQHWLAALEAFRAVREAGVRSAALEYNIGNTFMRLGDVGRAIVHYRRAERLQPRNRSLQINLDQARQQVQPRIAAESGPAWPLFWTGRTTLWERVWMTGALSVAGWFGLAFALRARANSAVVAICIASILLSLAVSASAILELRGELLRPPAVVIAGDQVLRSGRGEGYEPAIQGRLGAGVEVRVVQERGGWVEIELRNGIRGWLPETVIERV